jgi:protein PhnA
MNLQQLEQRSNKQCELCKNSENVSQYSIITPDFIKTDTDLLLCSKCIAQIDKKEQLSKEHWQCLQESMWSEVTAAQIISWRMLNRFRTETWASDLLDMMYLDEENEKWAKVTGDHENDGTVDLHKDSNGALLLEGDTVVLIKSLDVKGSTLNAKMGTVVKNIRLDKTNTDYIEGKIEGQTIVILTKYVRKQN